MSRLHILALAGVLSIAACAARERRPFHDGFIPLADGTRLYYRVHGAGRDTVVLLHGGPGLPGRYLDDPFAALANDHVIIAYDQRGRGRSDFPADTMVLSAATDVGDLETVRTFFHLDRLTLVGHGWGAGLGVLYAMQHPERVNRLLLVSPMFPSAEYLFNLTWQRAAGRDTSGLDGLMAARLSGVDRSDPLDFCRRYWGALLSPTVVRDRVVLRRLRGSVCDAPAPALGRVEQINRRVTGSLGAWNWAPRLAHVHAPVLVIQGAPPNAGERDEGSTWVAAAHEWVTSLPDARLALLGTTPQFPWLDAEPGFTDSVRQFLDHAP